MGTLRLLEAVCAPGSRVKRFVYGSTDSVYRVMRPESNPIREDDFKRPGNYYGTSKLVAETLVSNWLWHHGIAYTIVRFGSVLAGSEVLVRFRYEHARTLLSQCAEGRNGVRHPLLEGVANPVGLLEAAVPDASGNPAVGLADLEGRSWSSHYTDIRDTVEGTIIAIEHPAAEGEAFHIVGPRTTEYVAGGRIMADRLKLPFHEVRVPDRWYFEMSTEKAERMLGFKPVWTYERMIDDALRSMRTGHKSIIEAVL
jgi:UDP-glucose 4-epimerase